MELKTYVARSMSDALAKVKVDLGRGAVILHTRTVKRGGVLGIGAKSMVEITATTDPRAIAARQRMAGRSEFPERQTQPQQATIDGNRAGSESNVPVQGRIGADPVGGGLRGIPDSRVSAYVEQSTARCAPIPSGPSTLSPSVSVPSQELSEVRDDENSNVAATGQGDAEADNTTVNNRSQTTTQSDPELRREIREIRSLMSSLLRKTGKSQHPDTPAELIDHYTRLISEDVAEELVVDILEKVDSRMKQGGHGAAFWDDQGRLVEAGANLEREGVHGELRKCITEMIPPAEPLTLTSSDRPTVVALVGPTGVGKTTTIAKLAANMKLREGKQVGLVTIDSYRIAAVEQLKTYAQILKVPLIPVLTPDDMRDAIRQLSDLDLILVDTAGRSQKDELRIAELSEFVAAAAPDQTHLVLSSTSREETIREAIDSFSTLGAQHVIFTKLDEAVGFGIILNVLQSVDMRLSYLTHGQSVPDDIEVGSAERVAQLILGKGCDSSPLFKQAAAATAGRGAC